VDLDAALAERETDPAGPDGQLEGGAAAGQLGQEVDRRPRTSGANRSAESAS
jgi:hypothetical protein